MTKSANKVKEPAVEQAAIDQEAGGDEKIELSREDFEKVKAHIESLQKDAEDSVNLAQRVQADFDNFRKRNASVRIDSIEEGKRDCIRALLPVLDNFDRAFENTAGVESSFLEGIRLVHRSLLDALAKMGMREISIENGFDPNFHDAMIQEAVAGKKKGEILAVLQKGYEVNGCILRHSLVKVAE